MATTPELDLPDLTGRTVIVTGATSGVGRATAAALADAGARVIMAVRNVDKGAAVAADLRATTPGAALEVRALDLADLATVRDFARDWTDPIDIMINNAGVMSTRRAETADGFELQLGHQPPRPLPAHHAAAASDHRSSRGRCLGRPPVGPPRSRRPARGSTAATGRSPRTAQSKLANLLFALELDRRLRSHAVAARWPSTPAGCSRISVSASTD